MIEATPIFATPMVLVALWWDAEVLRGLTSRVQYAWDVSDWAETCTCEACDGIKAPLISHMKSNGVVKVLSETEKTRYIHFVHTSYLDVLVYQRRSTSGRIIIPGKEGGLSIAQTSTSTCVSHPRAIQPWPHVRRLAIP